MECLVSPHLCEGFVLPEMNSMI